MFINFYILCKIINLVFLVDYKFINWINLLCNHVESQNFIKVFKINDKLTFINYKLFKNNSNLNLYKIKSQSNDDVNEDDIKKLVTQSTKSIEVKKKKRKRNKKLYPPDIQVHAPRPTGKNVKSRYNYVPIPTRKQGKKPKDNTVYPFMSSLRIHGGSIRGRKLCSPPVYLRPMMSRVKGSLFSTLQFIGTFYPDRTSSVIDLFCGTGSVGLEALSYGADNCTFVDLSLECCKATSLNVDHCGFQDKSRIIRADAKEVITSPWLYSINNKFDLLFACPPYEEVIYQELIESIAKSSLLNKNAAVVIEYPSEISHLPHNVCDGKLLGIRNRRYGRTIIAIYLYNPSDNRMELVEDGKKEFVPSTYNRKRLIIEGYIKKPSDLDPFVI